jgi:hypothetical protein
MPHLTQILEDYIIQERGRTTLTGHELAYNHLLRLFTVSSASREESDTRSKFRGLERARSILIQIKMGPVDILGSCMNPK